MRQNKYVIIVLLLAMFLFACSDEKNLKDLRDYVGKLSQVSANKNKAKSQTLSLQIPKAVTYQPSTTRSPFQAEATSPRDTINNPLQAYPLEVLQLKGTIAHGDQLMAYIQTPDGKVYEVKLGDVIGEHYGKIISISPEGLQVEEQVTDDSGRVTKRIGSIELKDAS